MRTVKILTAGEGAVGKTTFLNRYINKNFVENFEMTDGVQFFGKILEYNGQKINLILWDFAGQYCHRHLLSDLVKGSEGAFFLFDTTRLSSIYRIEEWMALLNSREKIPTILIGTKQDRMSHNQEIHFEEYAKELMSKFDNCIAHLNISSKTGYNVEKAFTLLFENVLK